MTDDHRVEASAEALHRLWCNAPDCEYSGTLGYFRRARTALAAADEADRAAGWVRVNLNDPVTLRLLRFALSDPVADVARDPRESRAEWSARAVVAALRAAGQGGQR